MTDPNDLPRLEPGRYFFSAIRHKEGKPDLDIHVVDLVRDDGRDYHIALGRYGMPGKVSPTLEIPKPNMDLYPTRREAEQGLLAHWETRKRNVAAMLREATAVVAALKAQLKKEQL